MSATARITQPVSVRLDPGTIERLDAAARKQTRTRAQQIVHLIVKGLDFEEQQTEVEARRALVR